MWFVYITITLLIFCVTNNKKLFNRILFNIYISFFYIAFLMLIIIWPFPMLNGRTVKNAKSWARLLKYVTVFYGVKWELRNGQVLAKDRGAVIVSNHQSTLDIVGMFQIWETADKMTVVGKKEVLYAGPLGLASYFAGVVFLDRKNPKNAYRQLEVIANVLKEKTKIWVFPEGTRNFDHTKFLPFKKGAFTMAVAAQTPIIPVVYSPYYFIDRKNYVLSKGRVIVQCLEEVSTTGLTSEHVPELIERVRDMMLAAYKELSNEVLATATKSVHKTVT